MTGRALVPVPSHYQGVLNVDTILSWFVGFWVIVIAGTALFAVGTIVLSIVGAIICVVIPLVGIFGLFWLLAALFGSV